MLTGVLATGAQLSGAVIVTTSNVSASMTAPTMAVGAFAVTGTIKNTGTLPQASGATVTISATGGTVTAPGCDMAVVPGAAVCTTSEPLLPTYSKTYDATVTPSAAGTAAVVTKVVTKANQDDQNAGSVSPADDTVTSTTTTYGLDVDLTNDPSTVKPGNDTRLDAALTNRGASQSGVSLTINTGGVVDTRLPLSPGCNIAAGDSGQVICSDISLGVGETVHLVAAVITPTTGTTMPSEATANGQHGTSASDAVNTTLDPNAKGAFVPPAVSVCSAESHESQCFSVPSTWEGGTVVHLDQKHLPGTVCGSTLCDPHMAEALWPKSDNPAHNDVNNPLLLHITYKTKQTCNGQGWGSGCHQLYWMNSPTDDAKPMPQCSTFRVSSRIAAVMSDVNTPCLNYVQRNSQGIVTYEVAILIDTLIPKISL